MSEEIQKAKAVRRAGRIQCTTEAAREIQIEIKEKLAQEEALYTARGYGGYIHTEDIAEIRKEQEELTESFNRANSTE